MKPMFAPALLAAVVLTVPAHVFANDTKAPATVAAAETASIRAAADRAVRTGTLQVAESDVPVPRAYQGRDRSRKQMGGGSKTGMVIGMVSALAGTAATVYMVKEMQKNNREATAAGQ
jgi:hypothetical protein